MTKLTAKQRHALAVVAAGEKAGRPAQVSDRTTTEAALPSASWFHVHYHARRALMDAGLVRDEMRPTGDGLYLTDAGRSALGGEP